jgi:hypothetical protein
VTAAPIVKEHRMSSQHREPRLKDMLGDSIVKAVMEADGVDPRQLEIELRRITARLRAARRTEHSPVGWKARSGYGPLRNLRTAKT